MRLHGGYSIHCPKRLVNSVTDNCGRWAPAMKKKTYVTENKHPAPLLSVTKFSESLGQCILMMRLRAATAQQHCCIIT
jgi:hypothetical protein